MKSEKPDIISAFLYSEIIKYRSSRPEKWSNLDGILEDSCVNFNDETECKIKPVESSIGTYDVQEPCRVKPDHYGDGIIARHNRGNR